MSNDCPKCGAKAIGTDAWACGSWKAVFDETHKQSTSCKIREQAQTIERLKAAGNDLEIIVLSNAPDLPVVGVVLRAWKEAKGE